jgi:heme oxygenase (mycobilin-producing)
MSIQVMIKRKWKVDKPHELLPLLEKLHRRAQEQSGYISGETLRSIEDPEDFLVVSKWEAAEDWKKWLNSKERREIQGRVDSLIGEKTFYEVYETVTQ